VRLVLLLPHEGLSQQFGSAFGSLEVRRPGHDPDPASLGRERPALWSAQGVGAAQARLGRDPWLPGGALDSKARPGGCRVQQENQDDGSRSRCSWELLRCEEFSVNIARYIGHKSTREQVTLRRWLCLYFCDVRNNYELTQNFNIAQPSKTYST